MSTDDDGMQPPAWWSAENAVRDDPPPDRTALALRLRLARLRYELQQGDVAATLGVPVSRYRRYEKGAVWDHVADIALRALEALTRSLRLRRHEPLRYTQPAPRQRRPVKAYLLSPAAAVTQRRDRIARLASSAASRLEARA